MKRTLAPLVVVVAMAAAACSTDDDPGGDSDRATTPDTIAPDTIAPDTIAPDTIAPESTIGAEQAAVDVGEWESIPGGEDCGCSDGSDFELWNRPADPTRVVLALEGGGACFSAVTCGPVSPIFTRSLELGESPGSSGILDADNPDNPLAGFSIVYVPYCTGDVHLGDRVNEYSDSVTIEHRGFANASLGLDTVLAEYPDVEQLVVAGSSAGAIPAPLFAGLAADQLTDTDILAFGDAAGGYPDLAEVNTTVGEEWGVLENVPDWPLNAGLTAEQWSIPGLYSRAGTQHPDITFARFDHAFDGVQTLFSGLLGVDASDLLATIDATEAQIETAGVPIASYIAPGDDHTILGGDDLYELEVDGVRFVEWFGSLVESLGTGDVPDDVRCTVCS